MYDAGKIIPGLIVFLGLVTIPVWYNSDDGMSDGPDYKAELEKLEGKECVGDAEYMRANHMQLLNDWRDLVVRDGERYVHDEDGKPLMLDGEPMEMSLTNACMKCHDSKPGFCDKCHDYLGVAPYCWDCHLTPEVLEQ